jgi:steroid 5-alpha reductase family enzyme
MLTVTILGGQLPAAALFFLGLCLAVSAIGFKKYVYFISIGYGYSIAAMAIVSCVLGAPSAGIISWIEGILIAAYGLRLGTFLVIRETKSSYQASQAADGDRPDRISLGLRLVIWPSVAVLYVMMYMPLLARFASEAAGKIDGAPWLSAAGAAVTALGLAIEAVADEQKSAAKKKSPGRFCGTGLYRLTRCPNYFGEILVWTGQLAACASLITTPTAWVLSAAGYVIIVLIMVGSARRLELKQEERYGSDPEFQTYTKSVPVYSLKNAKVSLG